MSSLKNEPTSRFMLQPAALAILVLLAGLNMACDPSATTGPRGKIVEAGSDHLGEDPCCDEHAAEVDDHESNAHGEQGSDLDQSVEALLQARCEHQMPAHQCEECRYEVGFVHAGDELFDRERGGVLESLEVTRGARVVRREVPGEVVFDGNRTVSVTPLTEGIVVSVAVDLGERVRAGQPLLELECPAYRELVAELNRAQAAQAAATADAAREEELFARKVCSEKDLLAARANLASVRSEMRSTEARLFALGVHRDHLEALLGTGDPGPLVLRSPIDGEVVQRSVSRGSRVAPGDALMVVADTSSVWVMADLYEQDLAAVVDAGREQRVAASVVVGAWPNRVFPGEIDRVGGTFDPVTRTARARVVVGNADGRLRAGMFARVELLLPAAGSTIMVPRDAVLDDEGRHFSFVHVDGPYWVRRPVQLGAVFTDEVEVVAGLEEGQRIVVKGAFLMKSDVLRSKMGAGCAD